MTRATLLITTLAATAIFTGTTALAEQYRNIAPEWRCHYPRKDRSFCKTFPNIALRKGICNPQPTMLGHIEWCREDVTITEKTETGGYETYEAVVITYRPVYENGAWGKKFKKTYRKQAFVLETPPIITK